MPQPTPGDVHVNRPLTNISVAYVQDQRQFVADQVFPNVPVQKQSDLYFIFNREDFLRDEAKVRAPSSESAGGGFAISTASYLCEVYAFHKDIDDRLLANADDPLDLEEAATSFVTQKCLIARERLFAARAFTTGIWGTDVTPSPLWSAASSTPRKDVETGKMAIMSASGFKPNTLVMGQQVFSGLRDNAAILDQFKYTSSRSIDADLLAGYFDIEKVIVAGAVFSNTVEGTASPAAPSFILGKHALLCYVPSTPSLMLPAAGYTFVWNGYLGMNSGQRIKRFRMENLNSTRIEGEFAWDLRVVAAPLGYFFNGAVA